MTETEKLILKTLQELEAGVKGIKAGGPKPDLAGFFKKLDELTTALPPDSSRDLLHYLHKKSYEKARIHLESQAP